MHQNLTRAEFERDRAYRRNRRIVVIGLALLCDQVIDRLGLDTPEGDQRLRMAIRGTVVLSGWLAFELGNTVYNKLYPLPNAGMHHLYQGINRQGHNPTPAQNQFADQQYQGRNLNYRAGNQNYN